MKITSDNIRNALHSQCIIPSRTCFLNIISSAYNSRTFRRSLFQTVPRCLWVPLHSSSKTHATTNPHGFSCGKETFSSCLILVISVWSWGDGTMRLTNPGCRGENTFDNHTARVSPSLFSPQSGMRLEEKTFLTLFNKTVRGISLASIA